MSRGMLAVAGLAAALMGTALLQADGPGKAALPPATRTFAAVFIVRGAVAGKTVGEYGLFVRDSGTAWTKLSLSNVYGFGLGFSQAGGTPRYYFAAGNGLHRSTDGGRNWRILTTWRTEEILSVVADPADPGRLYVGTPLGVFVSTDGGAAWVKHMTGFRKWFIQRISMDARDRQVLYAASEDDLYWTTNGGAQWAPMQCGAEQVLSVLQSPADRQLLVIGAEDHGIRFSRDGGRRWSASRGLEGSSIYALRASADGKDLYAAGWRTGLWRSEDNAASWQPVWGPDSLEAIYSILVDPGDARHLLVGTVGGGIYESLDRGAAWCFAGLPGAQVKQIEIYP